MSCATKDAEDDTPAVVCVAGTKDAVMNLKDKIDYSKISVLNADDSKGGGASALKAILKADPSTAALRSDADVDAQLLIFVPFQEAVNIRGICFTSNIDAKAADAAKVSGPKNVKVFVQAPNLDFDGAASSTATQSFVLTGAQLDGRELITTYVKFQNVLNLTIFIENNQKNAAVTLLNRLSFMGTTKAGFNVANIKKVG